VSVESLQRGLERALARAGQADDRELAGRVREDGHRLVFLLNGLIRASRLYTADNAALEIPSRDLAVVLRGLLDLLGVVHLVCVEDQVYVNDVRIRVRVADEDVVRHLIQELDQHEVGGISFHAAPGPESLRALARATAGPAGPAGEARAALATVLAEHGSIELSGRYRFRVKGEKAGARLGYHEIIERGRAAIGQAVADLSAGRLPNPLPVRRAVIELVDSSKDNPGRAAAFPLRRREQGIAEEHALSVCSLAIQLGQAVGLSDASLSDLGVAAMLHDVGYTLTPTRDGHCAAGARLLLRQRGFHEGKVRRLLAVAEHHLPFDGRRPTLFARILRIVDDYDVLAGVRPSLPQIPPATAQASMWAARGTQYDPDLLALFVQTMGLYPPGSLLELSDGRRAVVTSGGRDPERFSWPVVRLVRDAQGSPLDGRDELDLFTLRDRLRPKRVVNPASHGVDIAAVLESAFSPPAPA
jgi:HD-GYP domain-containing protein (c-di-GMP phosphodiesterase class II)